MNKTNFALGVALVAVIIAIGSYFKVLPSFGNASGPQHYQQESFLQGLTGGTGGQFQVSNKGVILQNGAETLTVEYPFSATSSIPVSIPNPFGTNGIAADPNRLATTTIVMKIIASI